MEKISWRIYQDSSESFVLQSETGLLTHSVRVLVCNIRGGVIKILRSTEDETWASLKSVETAECNADLPL